MVFKFKLTAFRVSIQSRFRDTSKRRKTRILSESFKESKGRNISFKIKRTYREILREYYKSSKRLRPKWGCFLSSSRPSCKWSCRKLTGGRSLSRNKPKSYKKAWLERKFTLTKRILTFCLYYNKIKLNNKKMVQGTKNARWNRQRGIGANQKWKTIMKMKL